MPRLFKGLFGILFILFALLAIYSLAGTSDADSFSVYHIDARDPSSSWMNITITLRPSSRPFVDLYLRGRAPFGKNRVRDFNAARDGRSLATWQTFPGNADIQRVWTGFSSEPVTITYEAHGQWREDSMRMLSYLGSEYGYLHSLVILYTPITTEELFSPGSLVSGSDLGRAVVSFDLPPGWQVVSPLDIENLEVQTAVLRDVYFTVGQLGQEEVQVGSDTIRLGLWQGFSANERERLKTAVPLFYETILSATGFPPTADTCFRALTVLPEEPIDGAVSGAGSLVVEQHLPSLARAMFQWWNGDTVVSASDAYWLKEGFTTYYQARLLYQSGIWTEAEYRTAVLEFQNQLWPELEPQPVNLVQASHRLAKTDAADAAALVNYGGALLAYQLDQALQAQGSSLDAIWPALKALDQPVDAQAFLESLQVLGGSDLRATAHAILYGQAALPGLPQP